MTAEIPRRRQVLELDRPERENIVGPQVTKAPAAEALRMAWGIPHQDTAAIGDGLNDVALLDQHGAAAFFDSLVLSTRPLTGEPLPTRQRARMR
ncbi:hypothetical protein GCM10027059_49420 [Myceligenerans halotolerans]